MGGEIEFANVRQVLTKKVPPNGQISGFKQFAGQEVVILVFEDGTVPKQKAR